MQRRELLKAVALGAGALGTSLIQPAAARELTGASDNAAPPIEKDGAKFWLANSLTRVYPNSPVIRVEPNTPAAVRKGLTVLAASERPEAATVRALFERVGTVVELPERLVDVAGAVTGVGPAYWALLAEAYTDSAVRHGIPAAQAATLVSETMAGTAALLAQTNTLTLRRGVTSPGGSTARGLAALERGGVRAALAAAMDDVVGGGS